MPCDSPIYIHVKFRGEIPFPCGKCPPCRKRRVDSWAFRLMQEDKISKSAHFVTLTYDKDHLPRSKNNLPTLVKSDLQKFWKRLRKNTGFSNIRYYAVGEYGKINSRPHYHAVVFNCKTPEAYGNAWSVNGSPIGDVHVGTVTGDSVAYCAGYVDKRKGIPVHKRDDRLKEFSCMSKGLGKSYPSDRDWET